MRMMEHQLEMVRKASLNTRYGFWLQPGLGKTVGTLAIIENWPLKTLVICPKSVMKAAWMKDAEDYFPELKVECCWDKTKIKRVEKILESDADVLVINIDLFKAHAQDFSEAGIRRLVVDESSMIKNHKAQRTKAIIEFADKMDSVYLLSGTPAPNCPTEYYTQVRAISKGVFGSSFYGFAHKYFYVMTRAISGRDVITGYKQKTDKADEFHDRLRHCSWSLTKEEALDLPAQTDLIRNVFLPRDDQRTYDMVYAGLATEMEGEKLNAAGQAKLMKMRQLTGGFYYTGEGTVHSSDPVKLKELDQILDEIKGEPVVIWASFTAEINMIKALIDRRGMHSDVIDGRTKDAGDVIERFQRGDINVLVCHPAAAGHGITLTAASYAVYYSMDFSYEKYQQSRDRIHRKGQTRPCTYYHLIAEGTVDEDILWAVRNKAKVSDAVLRMIGRW
jgi:SNF2 family DNA or RNA helicase